MIPAGAVPGNLGRRRVQHWGGYLVRLWLLLSGFVPFAQAAPLLLDDATHQFPLAGHLEAFYDDSGLLTQQDVASAQHAQRFRPLAGNFNGGFSQQGAWWLRFQIKIDPAISDSDWWLRLGVPYVDYVDVWLPQRESKEETEETALQHRAIGGLRPVSARDLPWSMSMLQLEALPVGEARWVWIRLAGDRTLSLAGEIMTLQPLGGRYQLAVFQIAAVIGMMLMMTAVSLVLGVSLPDRIFLLYSAYLGSSALLFLCSENFLSVLFLPDRPLLAVRIHSVAMCLGLFTSIVFAHSLLRMPAQFPRTGAVFRGLAWLSAIACIVSAAGHYGAIAPLINLLRLLLAVVSIVLCAVLVRRSLPGAWPNLIGYSVYGAAGLVHFAKNLNWLPYSMLTQYSYLIGVVVHMFAIFLSLGLRVRSRERRALADSLEAGLRLEANVATRTRQLRIEVEERQRAQTQLQTAMAEQRNFLSMVSHELRTPLAVIGASAEMISDDRLTASRGDVQRESAKIGRAKQRMLGLVETLLAEEWLNSSVVQLNRSDIDLAELLADCAEDHRLASQREIRFDAEADALRVNADERLLHIVFDNLIENAIKYSPDGSPIEITARREAAGIVVAVCDHGAGFDETDLGRVFERFYRAGTVRRKPGVGLGLYMVQRIVELHGGSVRAGNAASGGAVVTVVLPLAETAEPGLTAAASAS